MYHRCINALGVFVSLFTLIAALDGLHREQLYNYKIWADLYAHFYVKANNAVSFWIDLIVLWLAIERTLACSFPHTFQLINKKSIAIGIMLGAGMVGFGLNLPYGFGFQVGYRNETRSYVSEMSEWRESAATGFEAYSLVLSISTISYTGTLLLFSLMALNGLIRMRKRKKKLAASGAGKKSQASRELLRQCSINVQLCILQMCETVPSIANELLFTFITIKYICYSRLH